MREAHTPAATENLVPYSKAQPGIFKTGQCTPVKDLKLLVRDYAVSGLYTASREEFTLIRSV